MSNFEYLGCSITTSESLPLQEKAKTLATCLNYKYKLKKGQERPALFFVDNLFKDAGLNNTGVVGKIMANRLLRRQRINTRPLKSSKAVCQVEHSSTRW